MVSLIKNQLLKHLSRYTKNLSSEKINISTFCGEGELSNLELDEKVLTELLELPLWLRLTSAWCNHVSFRISWTKLRSVPITLSLDEVNITVETCEFTNRNDSNQVLSGLQSLSAPQGKYSFIHRIIDGITIIVNTVNVNFKSPAFTATVQMSRIRVESKTPKWLLGDLRVTRLKDKTQGLLLIFKELSWQTVRIEASSTQDTHLTPLRLLTNHARCRITIKKKLSDCSILASRLVLILDDLLWVLTDSQLKAALHFVDSLSSLIQASTNLTQKTKAKKKLETLPEYQGRQRQQQHQTTSAKGHPSNIREDPANMSPIQKSFNLFDVRETSYHFFSQHIDLHLCDDPGDGRSCHPNLNDGGALQISVHGFQTDYYPFHLARSDRSHWPKYRETSVPPYLWLEQSLNAYRESLLNLSQPNRPSSHPPLERSSNIKTSNVTSPTTTQSSATTNTNTNDADQFGYSHSGSSNTPMDDSPAKRKVTENLEKLMTSCVILRIEDFTLHRVTTAGKTQMPKEFISGDKDRFSFPPEISTLHAEFTYFYFPGDNIFPLPPSKIFVHLNPIQIHFHLDSVLWFNSFILNLHKSLLETSVAANGIGATTGGVAGTSTTQQQNEQPSIMYMDVKLEAIMPRIVFEAAVDQPTQRDRPKILQIQIARFALTNIREVGSSRADLAQALHSLQEGSLVFGTSFPSKADDLCIVTDRILSHVAASDITSTPSSTPTATGNTSFINPTQSSASSSPSSSSTTAINLTRYALWDEPRDVWCIKLDPIWIDFLGTRSVGLNKPVPFVDAVPVTIWMHGKSNGKQIIPEKSLSQSQSQKEQQQQQQQQQQQNQPPSHQSLTKTDNTLVLSVANLNQTFIDKSAGYETNTYLNNTSCDVLQMKKNTILKNPFLFDDDDDDDNDEQNIQFQNQLKKITPLNPIVIGGGGGGADSNAEDDDDDGDSMKGNSNENNVNTQSADLYLMAHVSNLVSVQIDHYQFLFILRLAEEITELTTFLSLDSNRILQKQQSSNSIIVGACIPQVEVTFVMPSQTPGKESSGCDAESVLPDSASLGDDLHITSHTNAWSSSAGAAASAATAATAAAVSSSGGIGNLNGVPLTFDPLKNNYTILPINGHTIGAVTTTQNASPIINNNESTTLAKQDNIINNHLDDGTTTMIGMNYTPNPNTHGHKVQILNTPTRTSQTTSNVHEFPDLPLEPQPTSGQNESEFAYTRIVKNRNSVTDSNNIISNVRKGFSTFFDNTFKTSTSDDASDTISVQSDISSDSDKCLKNMIADDDKMTDLMDVMFRLNPGTKNENTLRVAPVEVASEVCEEQQYKTNTSSPSEPSEGSTWKRRDLVSMATFRLTTVEIVRQNRGYLSSLKLQIAAITCDECGAIPWDELQTKFSARCRAWNIATYNPDAIPCIQLRLDEILTPPPMNAAIKSITDKKCLQDLFSHNVDVHVNDLTLDLSMSTVIGLGDLTEDENIPKPLPLNLLLKNVKINIMDDRPPVNITSPGPIPINVQIGRMFLKRDKTGIFNIQPIDDNDNDDDRQLSTSKIIDDRRQQQQQQQQEKKKERDREILSLQLIMQQLKMDNTDLRKQLIKMEKSLEDQLSFSTHESNKLKNNLKRAQDYISELLDEKRTLLDTVRSLEVQTLALDKTRNFNPNR